MFRFIKKLPCHPEQSEGSLYLIPELHRSFASLKMTNILRAGSIDAWRSYMIAQTIHAILKTLPCHPEQSEGSLYLIPELHRSFASLKMTNILRAGSIDAWRSYIIAQTIHAILRRIRALDRPGSGHHGESPASRRSQNSPDDQPFFRGYHRFLLLPSRRHLGSGAFFGWC
jgi:hypothetical protein